jgi:hypothetical protein
MEKVIEIDYIPRDHFIPLHDSDKRWKVVVAHRRSGKTIASINHLQRDALSVPESRFAYIAPTYKQSKNIAWDALKQYAKDIPGTKFNESELRCDYPNGSRITLYGADNPDSLRGIGLWGVVFDEYSQQPSNIFTEIIRPALSDHQGYAIWIGTPKGKNEFWKLYEHGKVESNWLSMFLTVSDTDALTDEEVEEARKIMNEDEFNQEFYCSFEAAIKGAYYSKQILQAREEERITRVPYDMNAKVITVWDLGIGDATSIGFFQRAGKEWHLFDFYEASGEGLAHYAKVLEQKNYVYDKHIAPHDIRVKELGTGTSRLEVAKQLGINFEIAPNLSIEDGINMVRQKFNTLWVDEERCSTFLHNISLYHKEWDDKRGEFKNKPFHDFTSHAADMLRYWAVSDFQEKEPITIYKPKWSAYGKR